MVRKRRNSVKRDMTNKEFEVWEAADKEIQEIKAFTGEQSGPNWTQVPAPKLLPLAILPDEVDVGPASPALPAMLRAVPADPEAFEPEPSRKVGG